MQEFSEPVCVVIQKRRIDIFRKKIRCEISGI
jgi:hypothetical protein